MTPIRIPVIREFTAVNGDYQQIDGYLHITPDIARQIVAMGFSSGQYPLAHFTPAPGTTPMPAPAQVDAGPADVWRGAALSESQKVKATPPADEAASTCPDCGAVYRLGAGCMWCDCVGSKGLKARPDTPPADDAAVDHVSLGNAIPCPSCDGRGEDGDEEGPTGQDCARCHGRAWFYRHEYVAALRTQLAAAESAMDRDDLTARLSKTAAGWNEALAQRDALSTQLADVTASQLRLEELSAKLTAERDRYRRDLCEIAEGCRVGVADQEEAKRRIIAAAAERDTALARVAELEAKLDEKIGYDRLKAISQERDRLAAELAEANKNLHGWVDQHRQAAKERDEARAEVERGKARTVRLADVSWHRDNCDILWLHRGEVIKAIRAAGITIEGEQT